MDNKMPSINNFSNMYRHQCGLYNRLVDYTIKPKLHGTNASIKIKNGEFQYRSKNRVLSSTADHMNFVKTMMTIEDEWTKYWKGVWHENDITIYGEWAGPGVQKTDAVSLIPQRTFFVFAVYDESSGVWTQDLEIHDVIDSDRVYEIPVIRVETLNFNQTMPVTDFVDIINEEVYAMEEVDHFIKAAFDVEGVGEGVVGSPRHSPNFDYWKDHTFKAKTEAHRVKKTKAPATTGDPLPQEAFAFADTYVTEARMKQAMGELNIQYPTMQSTADIIRWMNTDIIKESLDDVRDMGIDYSKMQKVVNTKIVAMWKEFVQRPTESWF